MKPNFNQNHKIKVFFRTNRSVRIHWKVENKFLKPQVSFNPCLKFHLSKIHTLTICFQLFNATLPHQFVLQQIFYFRLKIGFFKQISWISYRSCPPLPYSLKWQILFFTINQWSSLRIPSTTWNSGKLWKTLFLNHRVKLKGL